MAVSVLEKAFPSREQSTDSVKREYVILGATSSNEAYDEFLAEIVTVVSTIPLRLDSVKVTEQASDGVYYGSAEWAKHKPAQPEIDDGCEIEFDIGTETAHRDYTLETITYGGGSPAPPTGAIGWTLDGEVLGVDILVPTMTFSMSRSYDPTVVTLSFLRGLYDLTGTTNDAPVTLYGQDFAEDELLFLGARGGKSKADQLSFNFSFGYSPTDSITVGSLGPITKAGWHYIWFLYETQEDGTANALKQVPVAYYIERVYPQADFSALDLCSTNPDAPVSG